jgi:CheY-like chemotaxis protein
MAGSRSTAPLNRNSSVLIVSVYFSSVESDRSSVTPFKSTIHSYVTEKRSVRVRDNGSGIDPKTLSSGRALRIFRHADRGIGSSTIPAEENRNVAVAQIRVLVVDDHALLRSGIAAVIAGAKDVVVVGEATNGQEAIESFRAHRPDVTLMDLQMPVMNGIDAIVAIRQEFPHARFIVLTTYDGDVQALRALKAGATGYL